MKGSIPDTGLVDPFTGDMFRYFPHGVSVTPHRSKFHGRWEIPPGTPLIWSPGLDLRWDDVSDEPRWDEDGSVFQLTELEAIRRGWSFPIWSADPIQN